jgi:hypothetical protein
MHFKGRWYIWYWLKLLLTWMTTWCSGWVCWLVIQKSRVQIPGNSWSFSEGLIALDWQSYLLKNKPCLEWLVCGVGKVKITYPHTQLGLNPQIGTPLSRIVVPLVYYIAYKKFFWLWRFAKNIIFQCVSDRKKQRVYCNS